MTKALKKNFIGLGQNGAWILRRIFRHICTAKQVSS